MISQISLIIGPALSKQPTTRSQSMWLIVDAIQLPTGSIHVPRLLRLGKLQLGMDGKLGQLILSIALQIGRLERHPHHNS